MGSSGADLIFISFIISVISSIELSDHHFDSFWKTMIISWGIGLIPEADISGSWINPNKTSGVFVKPN